MQSSAISTLEIGFTDSLVASIPRIHGSPIWASSSRSPGVSHPNVTLSTPCTLPFHHFPPAHKIPGRVILSQGSICLSLGLIMSLSLQSTLPVYVSLSHGISAKYFVSKSQYLMVSQRSILPIPRSHYVMVTGRSILSVPVSHYVRYLDEVLCLSQGLIMLMYLGEVLCLSLGLITLVISKEICYLKQAKVTETPSDSNSIV